MKRSKRRRAVVVGFEYYGRFLAKLVNEHSEQWSLSYFGSSRASMLLSIGAVAQADALICFGGPGPDLVLAELAHRRRIPVVVIWAGTDVTVSRSNPGQLAIYKQYNFTNVSDGPWLVDELRQLGINATYEPVTAVETPERPSPMPAQFGVISYLPEPRRSFYGEKAVYAIARAFPDVRFTVVGKGAPNPIAPPNVRFLGYVGNMPQLLDANSVLLRMPEHDGKSMLVLETLARGRHVVWNYAFPGVRAADGVPGAIEKIRDLKVQHERGELGINTEGFEYVKATFPRRTLALRFSGVLDAAFERSRQRDAERPRRVAISGLPLFSAQVADLLREAPLSWEPHLLSATGNLERVAAALQLRKVDVWYSIGSPMGDRWLHLVARMLRVPRVMHWVGSDLRLLADPQVRSVCRERNVTHLGEVGWTLEELAQSGLTGTLAPLPPRINAPDEPPPLPERFTVLLYLPQSRGEFYGRREYERLLRAFAGLPVRFLVVGNGGFYSPPDADVAALGWCADMLPVYAQTSVLLRFTSHDGLALMALEALACGRHVLWSQDFPFSTKVSSYDDCERELRRLFQLHQSGELHLRREVAQEIRDLYDPQKCISRLASIWDISASGNRASKHFEAGAFS